MARASAGGKHPRRAGVVAGKAVKTTSRQHARIVSLIGRQIDHLYIQLDTHLTSMAHIQLQFDELRLKLRKL